MDLLKYIMYRLTPTKLEWEQGASLVAKESKL